MSVSSISGATPPAAPPAQDSSVKTAFQQLTSAISAGDVKAAQTAYATLISLQQSSGQSSTGPFAQALPSIGDALGKGDIAGAQRALGAVKGAHGKHHHHGAPPADATSSNDNDPSATTASSATPAPTSTTANIVDVSA